jgi:hypothetical protein
MRRHIFIISAFLFISSATELHQLTRLPALVKHFHHHRSEDPSMSLFGFLKLHYSDDHPADNDDNEDGQLPFKSPGTITHIDIPIQALSELTIDTLFWHVNKPECLHPEGAPTHISYSIFHPPQAA